MDEERGGSLDGRTRGRENENLLKFIVSHKQAATCGLKNIDTMFAHLPLPSRFLDCSAGSPLRRLARSGLIAIGWPRPSPFGTWFLGSWSIIASGSRCFCTRLHSFTPTALQLLCRPSASEMSRLGNRKPLSALSDRRPPMSGNPPAPSTLAVCLAQPGFVAKCVMCDNHPMVLWQRLSLE